MIPTSIDGTDITGATIDGTDVQEITVDGDVVFSAVSDAILSDDFDDNQLLSNRTSYSSLAWGGPNPNGKFNPIGRFNWDTGSPQNSPSASGGELVLQPGEACYQNVTFDLSNAKTIWEFEWDLTNSGTGGSSAVVFTLFAPSNPTFSNKVPDDAYSLWFNANNFSDIRFRLTQNGNTSTLNSGGNVGTNVIDIRVERDTNGTFEVFQSNSSVFTVTVTTFTTGGSVGLATGSGDVGTHRIDYVAVYEE